MPLSSKREVLSTKYYNFIMKKTLFQLILIISCFILFQIISESESTQRFLVKIPFKQLSEFEKEKTATNEYLIDLYHLQYIKKRQDSRNSICTSMERLDTRV